MKTSEKVLGISSLLFLFILLLVIDGYYDHMNEITPFVVAEDSPTAVGTVTTLVMPRDAVSSSEAVMSGSHSGNNNGKKSSGESSSSNTDGDDSSGKNAGTENNGIGDDSESSPNHFGSSRPSEDGFTSGEGSADVSVFVVQDQIFGEDDSFLFSVKLFYQANQKHEEPFFKMKDGFSHELPLFDFPTDAYEMRAFDLLYNLQDNTLIGLEGTYGSSKEKYDLLNGEDEREGLYFYDGTSWNKVDLSLVNKDDSFVYTKAPLENLYPLLLLQKKVSPSFSNKGKYALVTPLFSSERSFYFVLFSLFFGFTISLSLFILLFFPRIKH